jgi:hypothetical protein
MLPAEFRGAEEEVTQMRLTPKEAMFKKPEESSQNLKLLYIRGHIDGKPISMILVDGGAVVNLMSYSIFKKLGREDDGLIKTNLTLNGVRGNPIEARGVVSMELTMGSKSLATAFFVIEVQGNYSVILGYNWIYANHCIPSTLHQFLIQWIEGRDRGGACRCIGLHCSSRRHGLLAARECPVLIKKGPYRLRLS